jgi:hypothetical protein
VFNQNYIAGNVYKHRWDYTVYDWLYLYSGKLKLLNVYTSQFNIAYEIYFTYIDLLKNKYMYKLLIKTKRII